MNLSCVSVVICCHGDRQFLREAIESALIQSYPCTEIIVVMPEADLEEPLMAVYPQVQWIGSPQHQPAILRNQGVLKSTGDYILFLDASDRLLPKALEVAVVSLELGPDWGFVIGTARAINSRALSFNAARDLLEQFAGTPTYSTLLSGECFRPSGRILFRRTVFEQVGNFDADLAPAEDYDFYLRVAAAFPSCRHNQVMLEYRESSPPSVRPSRSLQRYLKALSRQKSLAAHRDHRAAYCQGRKHWQTLHQYGLVYETAVLLRQGNYWAAAQPLAALLRHYPQGLRELPRQLARKLVPQRYWRSLNSASTPVKS